MAVSYEGYVFSTESDSYLQRWFDKLSIFMTEILLTGALNCIKQTNQNTIMLSVMNTILFEFLSKN